eukprot:13548439-Alexandrium_andersonii.AAC.1
MFCTSWVGAPARSPDPPVKAGHSALDPLWAVAVPLETLPRSCCRARREPSSRAQRGSPAELAWSSCGSHEQISGGASGFGGFGL